MFGPLEAESRAVDARPDTAVFRIAHVSDLHLAEQAMVPGYYQSVGLRGKLGLVLQAVRQHHMAPVMTSHDSRCFRTLMDALTGLNPYTARGYDGYLITGDIASTGNANDMRAAAELLRRQGDHPGAETLHGRKLPADKVVLLPGNHDRYHGRRLLPESAEFERGANFGTNWSFGNPKHGDVRSDVGEEVLKAPNGVPLAVVTGDFSFVKSSRLRYFKMLGRGRARPETLEKMISITKSYLSQSIAVVWAVHFPPASQGVPGNLKLDRQRAVIDAAESSGVQLIFCGHTHVANTAMNGDYGARFTGIRIVCAGSASEYQKQDSPGQCSYFEVELEVRGTMVRQKRAPVEMIYSGWLDRTVTGNPLGRGRMFCPAP